MLENNICEEKEDNVGDVFLQYKNAFIWILMTDLIIFVTDKVSLHRIECHLLILVAKIQKCRRHDVTNITSRTARSILETDVEDEMKMLVTNLTLFTTNILYFDTLAL